MDDEAFKAAVLARFERIDQRLHAVVVRLDEMDAALERLTGKVDRLTGDVARARGDVGRTADAAEAAVSGLTRLGRRVARQEGGEG